MYNDIPDAHGAYLALVQAFERCHHDVRIELVPVPEYYDEDAADSILKVKADIYELDSVFLADFVKAGRIQPLPGDWSADTAAWLPFAKAAAMRDGKLFGAAHWLCGNFLIFRVPDEALAKARTLADVIAAFKTPFPDKWLVADFKGRSTLGEMYLDGLMDRYKSSAVVLTHVDPAALDPDIVGNMGKVIDLMRPGFGRDGDYHAATGFYQRQFGRGVGRAMVSYSEGLHDALDAGMNDCRKDEACLAGDGIMVAEWPLADQGSSPIAWVDLLTIASEATGQKLIDAEEFIRFVEEPDTYKLFLVPDYGQAPRYLLPARAALFTDAEVTKAAPLYPAFLHALTNATAVTGLGLNSKLRAIGKILDGQLKK